jgi:hypothetical protein
VKLVSVSASGDQPGARIEDHSTLVAVARRERVTQALDGTRRLAVAQARECRARVLNPRTPARHRGRVRRLVDVLEVHSVDAGALEDARGGFGVGARRSSSTIWRAPTHGGRARSRSAGGPRRSRRRRPDQTSGPGAAPGRAVERAYGPVQSRTRTAGPKVSFCSRGTQSPAQLLIPIEHMTTRACIAALRPHETRRRHCTQLRA